MKSDQVMMEGRTILSRLHGTKVRDENVTQTFADIGEEFGTLSTAEFEITVSGRVRDLRAVAHEELIKIGREALFNAFRHAQATRIEVEVHFGIAELRVRFRDNGLGLDPAVLLDGGVTGHYGLSNMRDRASAIGAHMELWSRQKAGTEIEIRMPSAIAYPKPAASQPYRRVRQLIRDRVL